jgi:hypothetical protein
LRRGWPVVVTGSKFFGGPPFCGAVLYPTCRRPYAGVSPVTVGAAVDGLGAVLRWAAAAETMTAFAPLADAMAGFLRARGVAIHAAIAGNPGLVPMEGLQAQGPHWADLPSIFTFAVRDARNPARLLTEAELRPPHAKLAGHGVLLGQPVTLGAFGGLRVAIGARDLLEDRDGAALRRVVGVLGRLASS